MKYTAIAGSLLLTSCATVLTKKNYNFKIIYGQENTKVRYKDSIYNQPAAIRVRRSKESLMITAFNDTISRRYEIKPQLNPMFVFMNLTSISFYPLLPVVYGIDLTNQKRFHYGNYLYINFDGTPADTSVTVIKPSVGGKLDEKRVTGDQHLKEYFNTQIVSKGDLYLSVSWPLILYNASFPGAGRKTDAGGWAFATGLEYYYGDRRALGINAGVSISTYFTMAGNPPEGWVIDPFERLYATYIDLYHKHTLKRFSFAYGLNYTCNRWTYIRNFYGFTPPDMPDARLKNHSFGPMFSGYYQFLPYLKFGVVYRPTLLRISPGTNGIYQHTISFDLAVTPRVKWKKK